MRSELLQKRGTAPVMNQPSGQQVPYEEDYGGLFCTEEEDDAAIQAILAEDPEGEKGTPYQQVFARIDREQAEWVAKALRKIRREGQ